MTVGLSGFFKRCREPAFTGSTKCTIEGGGHSFVSLVFPKLKVNNNRSSRLQPGFIKGGHIICHILQYNRHITGGGEGYFLVFFQHWRHVPREYMVVTPIIYYDKVISALFFNSETQ